MIENLHEYYVAESSAVRIATDFALKTARHYETHNENKPIQIYRKVYHQKLKLFR